ncbi:MAG TPA: hypothetical protein DDY39_15610, partial [Nitrospira sp.]|nr:hypothetical protein [Nitrospira sp.]
MCRAKFLAHKLDVVYTTSHPERVDRGTGVGFEEAKDDILTRVVGVWAHVLGRPHVGPHDNFFELGGDSLRGT